MAQLEYGDYYKFVASAGIAFVAGAVVLPWMFLREPFDLAIEASRIGLLTPDAQAVIHERQHLVALVVHVIPCVSAVLAFVGLATTIAGLKKWNDRQFIRDKSEDLGVEKLSKELEQMTPAQIEQKAESDIEDAEQEDVVKPALTAHRTVSPVSAYLATEQALLGRISGSLGHSMKVLSNQRLGNVSYDAIIRAGDSHRIIVEIKYIRKGFNRNWLAETVTSLVARMALYGQKFDGETKGLLIVVIATSNSPLSRKVLELSEDLKRVQPSLLRNIRVRTIYEADIATVPDAEIRELVLGDLR